MESNRCTTTDTWLAPLCSLTLMFVSYKYCTAAASARASVRLILWIKRLCRKINSPLSCQLVSNCRTDA